MAGRGIWRRDAFLEAKNGLFLDLAVGYLGVPFITLYFFFLIFSVTVPHFTILTKEKKSLRILRLTRGTGVSKKKKGKKSLFSCCNA